MKKFKLTDEELIKLQNAAEDAEKRYNDKLFMLSSVSTATYHSGLNGKTVHSTREAICYARALLDLEDDCFLSRAAEIIDVQLKLQDTDPKSPTFGIWSWYYEEPLDKMDAPDFNWAIFMGIPIIDILDTHSERLDCELKGRMLKAIEFASESIIRRQMGVQYTNITAAEIFTTLKTGRLTDNEKYWLYGREKLKQFTAFTYIHGDFFEYNSPTYTSVTAAWLYRLTELLSDDTELFKMADWLYDLLWKGISQVYHYNTAQWTGAQSRAYFDLLTDEQHTSLSLAVGLSDEFPEHITLSSYRESFICPDKYKNSFTKQNETIFINKRHFNGATHPFFMFTQSHAHMVTPEYAFGSFNQEEFWNQRRPLNCYFGTRKSPSCFRVRCLHDGYDYSSAQLHTVQHKNVTLSQVVFALDRGDTHISLDLTKNGSIIASDLRLRFEISGSKDNLSIEAGEKNVIFHTPYLDIFINIYGSLFGENAALTVVNESLMTFDVILYSGDEKTIDFNSLKEAWISFGIGINNNPTEARVSSDGQHVSSILEYGGHELKVKTPCRPKKFISLMTQSLHLIDENPVEQSF